LVEHDSFRDLLRFCRPTIEIPHRTQIKTNLLQRFDEARKGMLHKLPSSRKISLALDCWTSPNKYSFLAISGYFISDDWDYHEILLGFKPLRGKHSGENLANYVVETLDFHNITKQLLTITADNAKNNGKLRRHLQKILKKKNIIWDYQQGTIRCMAHTIQLAVNEFFSFLGVKISDVEEVQSSKKRRFDHISLSDTGYNNVFLKVCMTYHINLSRKLICLVDPIDCDSRQIITTTDRALHELSKS